MNSVSTQEAARNGNLAVLANALTMGSEAIMDIAGNDIANTVDGTTITTAYVQEALAARIGAALSQKGHS